MILLDFPSTSQDCTHRFTHSSTCKPFFSMYTMYIVILPKHVYFIRFFIYIRRSMFNMSFFTTSNDTISTSSFFTVLECLCRLLFFIVLQSTLVTLPVDQILYCIVLYSFLNIYNHSLGLLSCALRFPVIPCSSIWQRAHTQIKSSAVSCPTLS